MLIDAGLTIGGINLELPQNAVKKAEIMDGGNDVRKTFNSFFRAAMDAVNETNTFQLAADKAQVDFATGKTDDILSLLLAQEKAYTSLNFTVQVTNKIIESYREIMRMQI